MRDRHHHILLGDQIFHFQHLGGTGEFRAAWRGVFFSYFLRFFPDNFQHLVPVRQDSLECFDFFTDFPELVLDFLLLEAGEALQPQFQDFPGLDFGEAVIGHQRRPRLRRGGGGLDLFDHRVQVAQGDPEPLQDVGAGLCLGQVIAGAPFHDDEPVLQEVLEHPGQRQDAGLAFHDGQHDDPEGRLELGVLVEVVQHHLRRAAPLDLDDDPHPRSVGLVAQVGDPLHFLVAHQVGDFLDQPGLVDHVRQLRDDDRLAIFLADLLHLAARPDGDYASPGGVSLVNALLAQDEPPGRKIRARHMLHQLRGGRRERVVQVAEEGIHDLPQVVGGNVAGHPHGDPRGALDE